MKVLSIIVLIILFPLFLLSLFDISLKSTVEKPEFIKKELATQNAYVKINKNLPELVTLLGENKGDGEAPVISNAELGSLLQQSLTADVLKQGAEGFLDGSKSLNAQVDVQKKLSDNFNTAIRAKYEALPACVSEEDMSDGTLCRDPSMNFDQLMAQMQAQKNGDPSGSPLSMLGGVPGVGLFGAISTTQNQQTQKSSNPPVFSIISKVSNMTYILFFVLLLIIYFLARGYAGSWLGSGKVFGIFIAVLSALSLLLNLLLSLFNKPLVGAISGFANKMPSLKAELITPLLNDVFGKISQMTSKISIVSAIIGVVLFIIFFIITKIKNKNQPVLADVQA